MIFRLTYILSCMVEPYISVPTGPLSEPVALDTPQDFVKFWNEFLEKWSWTRSGNWSRVLSNYNSDPYEIFFDQINNVVEQIKTSPDDPRRLENAKNVINGQLQQWKSKSPRVLCPKSPQAILVLETRQKYGDDAGLACLSYFIKSTINLTKVGATDAQFLAGFWEAFLFEKGITDPTPYQASIFDDFIKNQTNRFSKTKAELEITSTEFQTSLIKAKSEAGTIKQEAESQALDFKASLESSKKRMAEFEDYYQKKLALLAPVTYWNSKSRTHLSLAILFGVVSLALGFGVGLYIVNKVEEFLRVVPGQNPETWRIAVLLVVGGLFTYLLRIVVKLFLSQVHLQSDASERAIMVQTYLSLEREGKLTDPDKKLILEALFRPVGAGLVQDDQAAVGMVEAVLSRFKS